MQFKIDGETVDLDRRLIAAHLRDRVPEQVLKHWVDVDGTRFPVKQALEAGSGIARKRFTSQTARSLLARLGFATGPSQVSRPSTPGPALRARLAPLVSAEQAGAAFTTLVTFLRGSPFTDGVSTLEHQLVDADRHTVTSGGWAIWREMTQSGAVFQRWISWCLVMVPSGSMSSWSVRCRFQICRPV